MACVLKQQSDPKCGGQVYAAGVGASAHICLTAEDAGVSVSLQAAAYDGAILPVSKNCIDVTIKKGCKNLDYLPVASRKGAFLRLVESCDDGTEKVLGRFTARVPPVTRQITLKGRA